MSDFWLLGVAAFFAGMVDAIGGGGGLIQVPALFSALPSTVPATLFGTNKLASIWGTAMAASQYARRVRVEWNAALPAAAAAFVFAFLGALTVTRIPPDFVRKLLPILLVLVLFYSLKSKDFGMRHMPAYRGIREKYLAVLVGAGIGFYDGFFGPGTGSFLVFLYVRFFGFDFLGASVVAKVVNVACNGAALLLFGFSGHVLWQIGALMAICNLGGAILGSLLAVRHGSRLVRKVFFAVVSLLILRTTYQAFFA